MTTTSICIMPLILGLGMGEIMIIALIILLLFGGRKIPELMKGLGKGVKSFKEGINEGQAESQKRIDHTSDNADAANKQ